MKILCIYAKNKGLGPCVGPIEKVWVAKRASQAWRGLEGLRNRLKASGEEPGVCGMHAKRAEVNGYLRGEAPVPPHRTP